MPLIRNAFIFFVLAFSIPSSAIAADDKRTYPDDWAAYKPLSELDWSGRSVRRATFIKREKGTKAQQISIEIEVDYARRLVRVNAKTREWRKLGDKPGGYIYRAMAGTAPLDKWNKLIALDEAILPRLAEPIAEPDPNFIPSTRACLSDEYYVEASNQGDEFWRRSSDECEETEEISIYFDEMVDIAFDSFSNCDEYSGTSNPKLGLFNCVRNWGRPID